MNADVESPRELADGDRAQGAGSAPDIYVTDADDAVADEWNDFCAAMPDAELYHDYRWRALITRVFGHESRCLVARDRRGRVRGVLPMVRLRSRLFGDFLVSMPYLNYGGILADSAAVARVLADAAAQCGRELGVTHVELRHRASSTPLDWPARDEKVSMLLDLPRDENELWSAFGSKLRAQIRRPQKEGATVRMAGAELLPDFYSVFAKNMRDLGTPVYPRRWFDAILSTFGDCARVCVVSLGGRPAAAGFVLVHRSTMEIPWASSLREANRSGVNMLLYWSVLREAVAAGCRTFDFGRSTRDSGTYRFKQQWGAREEPLRWHYWLRQGETPPVIAPSNPKYRLAIAAWKKLPVAVATALGPHIVKYLP